MNGRVREPEGDFRYRHPLEVRFVDTDALGHVNNAVYLSYFEAARAGYYRAVTGSTFGTEAEPGPWTFVVAEARISYRAPAFFGEQLWCECRVAWASRSSFGLEYRVGADDSDAGSARLVAYGETTQVMYDFTAGHVTRLPRELLELFSGYEGRAVPRTSQRR